MIGLVTGRESTPVTMSLSAITLVKENGTDNDIFIYGNINIKINDTGKIISPYVSSSDTVGSVKVKIQTQEDIPFDKQELIYNEKVLDNLNSFTNLGIKKGSTLTLLAKSVDQIKIFVITSSGKTIPLLVDPKCTITDLKTMIKRKEDIPCAEQALIFNDTVLGDNDTLFDYYIKRNATLKLMRQSTGLMEIDIYMASSGEIETYEVKHSDTIYSVKAKIKDYTDKPIDEQDLIFNGTVLHNDDTLAGCGIVKGSTLTLLWSARVYNTKIFIKTSTGKTLTLYVKPSDTIYNLKSKIEDKEGIPPCKQRLMCAKISLEDSATVADYAICDGDEVYLVLLV